MDKSKKNSMKRKRSSENYCNDINNLDGEGSGDSQLNDTNQAGKGGENGSPPSKKKRTSHIWPHFNVKFIPKENCEFAYCKHCAKDFRLGGKSNKSTGNLIRHMRIEHSDIYSGKPESSQKKFEFSQKFYREALIKWIVNSDQPFCECQQKDFVALLKALNPEASLLSQQTIKRDILKKFEEGVADIKLRLGKVTSKIAFTADGWTSKNVLPFMNIRAHWLNDDWTYESVIVDFSFIEGNHSGKNLCKIFVECLKRFDIPLSKVSAVTMDNITSNNTFMKFLGKHGIKSGTYISPSDNRIRCLPHVLNLAVQDILKSLKIPLNYEEDQYVYLDEEEELNETKNTEEGNEEDEEEVEDVEEDIEEEEEEEEEEESEGEEQPEEKEASVVQSNIDPTMPKLRNLVKKIRKSPQMREKLKKVCSLYEMKYLAPIIDVATRWDSTFDMLERAKYLQAPLGVMCSKEKTLKDLLMTDREWAELNTLRSLLKKFRRSTKYMSMERHPTICAYLPTVNWIIQSVESFIQDNPGHLAHAAQAGLMKLRKYEDEFKLAKCRSIYIGVFLNPALKLNFFKEHGYTKTEIKDIQKSICEVFEKNYKCETGQDVDEEQSDVDEFLTYMYKRSKTNREPKEFQKYLNHPLSNSKVNILEFWRSQKDEFPNLSKMALDYLPIQGGSVPVERDFSKGTHLVTPTRCSLNPQSVRACMCLKSWFKELEPRPSDNNRK